MPKHRKTRKQKEQAHARHIEQLQHVHVDTPTYTISGIQKVTPTTSRKEKETTIPSDRTFMKKDITSIAAATGIVLAFDILLLALLTSGTLKLNFLGY